MTEDSLVYSFMLVYSPSPIPNSPVVKTNDAMVAIHCVYQRKLNVSSNAVVPTWMPYAAMASGSEQIQFKMKLLTDDWSNECPFNTFYLGDFINLEVSVLLGNHIPLQVFVDYCMASSDPSGTGTDVYMFIDNNGCMVDAKLTNSQSMFMPRMQDDKLHFQLEAFRFKEELTGVMYLTCYLKAVPVSWPEDAVNKACSFIPGSNSWISANGDNQVCGCCQTSCGTRRARSLEQDYTVEDKVLLGPIFVLEPKDESVNVEDSSEVSAKDAESSFELVLMVCLMAGFGVLSAAILGALFCYRRNKKFVLTVEQ
ncbi:hypothetical protein DNTS_032256 [Danionella cerebrum]|uniref:Zona pellucida sperm-binding protein 3 n=1 Tax=Danionella cerebrum TaxID=2873325 RepID=A0A553RDG2_9TELE|nr:hypothetical protein DNTS_032256 [Danionella translucida]